MSMPDNVELYQYSVDSVDILYANETVKIENVNVTGFTIENDYENNYFPIFKLNVLLKKTLYFSILKNKLDVKFRVRIQKVTTPRDSSISYYKDIINGIFTAFIDEDTPYLDKELDKRTYEVEDGVARLNFGTEYSFYLFKESDLNKSKIITDSVLKSCDMKNAITYLLATNKIDRVLMSPIENKEVYSQIILQPITLLGNLLYLDEQYGFYDNGSVIYFDMNVMYILNKKSKCTAWREKENKYCAFMIKTHVNPDSLSQGNYYNKTEGRYYINISRGNHTSSNISILNDQIEGNNVLVINPLTSETTKIHSDTKQRGSGTYKVVFSTYGNERSISKQKVSREEIQSVHMVTFGDFDIDSISPNKEFIFIFEDKAIGKEQGGNYRMCNNLIEFVKNGETFKITCNAQFKKQA